MSQEKQKEKIQVENISCIISPNSKIGGLYLGNFYGAKNQAILKQYGVRAVVNLSPQVKIIYDPISIPFFKRVAAHDKQNYSILSDLNSCIDFIHKHRKITNVYVHCYAGVSRSATVIIAYIMKIYNMDLKTALDFVKNKRIVTKPNEGFLKQLEQFEISIAGNKLTKEKSTILKQQLHPTQAQNRYRIYNKLLTLR